MIEYYKTALESFPDIIISYEPLNVSHHLDSTVVSTRVYFIDGSFLDIYDRWKGQILVRYNYYWVEAGEVLTGWDNYPRHSEVETFPHHKHTRGKSQIVSSQEHNLVDVLSLIHREIGLS